VLTRHRRQVEGRLAYLQRDQGLRYMKSIERKADAPCIGGLSGDAGNEVRVAPHSIRGAQ